MMISYRRESLREVREAGMDALLLRHWAEIAHYHDIPLDVDWAAYESAEKLGRLFVYTARDDGKLVGYVAYLVAHAPHYVGSLQAVQDVLFLAPEQRGGRVGMRLVKFSHDQLASDGVQVVYQHSKAAHPMDALLTRLGYEMVDTIWAKRLDRG